MNFKDGIYQISNKDYHNDRKYISSSALKLFPDKKDEYIARYYQIDKEETKSEAIVLGTAIHKFILEFNSFYDDYIIMSDGLDKRTKEGKKIFTEIYNKSLEENKIIINNENFSLIKKIQKSIENHPVASKLLNESVKEQSFFLKDDNLKQKVRADAIKDNLIIDLKTIDNIDNFPSRVINLGYNFSAIMYETIISKILNKEMNFIFIVVQKQYPYTCIIRQLSYELKMIAIQNYEKAKESFKNIQDTGEWDLIQEVEMPLWANK